MIALILLVLLPNLAYQYEVFYDDSIADNCLARCKDQPIGYKIQDPSDCVGYILCHGDFVLQQYCASGEKFDESLQKCVRGKCPPCNCSNSTPAPPDTTTPSDTETETDTTTPSDTETETDTTTPSDTETETDTTTPSQDLGTPGESEPQDCINRPEGYRFPNKDHCRLFWICHNGVAVKQFCQIGLWYQRTKNVCDFTTNVHDCPANQN